jgi:hypothetical protein
VKMESEIREPLVSIGIAVQRKGAVVLPKMSGIFCIFLISRSGGNGEITTSLCPCYYILLCIVVEEDRLAFCSSLSVDV